jgi:cell division protein FtsB
MRGIKNKESGQWKKVSAFVILFLILVVLLNSTKNVYDKKKAASEALAKMQKEDSDLQNREAYLKDSISKLSTTEGVEFELRQKLNVAAAGEGVAVIVDQKQSTTTSTSQPSTWQKIKDFFGSLFR